MVPVSTDIREVAHTLPAVITMHQDHDTGLMLAKGITEGDSEEVWCASWNSEEAAGRVVTFMMFGDCSFDALVSSSAPEAVDTFMKIQRSQA